MIRTKELTKIFRTEEIETTALNKVDLQIAKGEMVAVMGTSGCGKSTLLNILGLLDNPTNGEFYFNGNEVSRLSERNRTNLRKGNIGFVFQSFNLIDELTVFENVELPLLYMKVSASERKRRVDEVLERMKIIHRKKHFPQQLSGGQQQRVAVARALASKPKFVLADEPTANLDSENSHHILRTMKKLNEEFNVTFLFASHDEKVIKYLNRIITLKDGMVVSDKKTTPELTAEK
ncbi:MAG: ABC transporter ATP-binding protein [Bacteroidales bacterium]|nr:ABC transporter ATP-binding protein [Bacteroidales bacterium]